MKTNPFIDKHNSAIFTFPYNDSQAWCLVTQNLNYCVKDAYFFIWTTIQLYFLTKTDFIM